MKPKEFFDLTREVRRLQKEYFKTEDKTTLAKSKLREAELDVEIDRVTKLGYQDMEQDELMFGDWIHTYNGFNLIVCQIRIDHVCCSGYRVFNYNNISPIPLTEEILKMNGIEENEDSNAEGVHYRKMAAVWDDIDEPCRVFDINFDPDGMFSSNKIKYVHELQHALRLCGMSHLANNFKIKKI